MAKAITEIKSLYNGEVEVVFYPTSHQYRVNKKRLTSVSGIVGYSNSADGLIKWAVGQVMGFCRQQIIQSDAVEFHEEQIHMLLDEGQREWEISRQIAADLGNYLHAVAQSLPTYDMEIQPEWETAGIAMLKNLKEWFAKIEYVSEDVERTVYSRKHNYIGTFDDRGRSKYGNHMLDYKTGRVYPKAKAQLAAYALAWNEEFPHDPVKKATIVDIDKETGEIKFHNVPLIKSTSLFKSFLRLHKNMKKHK